MGKGAAAAKKGAAAAKKWYDGIAGTTHGSFFEAEGWVDKTKGPGMTSQAPVYGQKGWWKPMLSTESFFFSPNLVWFIIAAALYLAFPYDFEKARSWDRGWAMERIVLNVVLTNVYVGFWYAILYHFDFGLATRKFNPDKRPNAGRMVHNIWYTTLGAAQWAIWEVIYVHLYATGRIPYIKDTEAFATPANITRMVLWTLIIPVFREFHFYWAHRLLHMRVLYKYVHSLHHRNVDPEPFSGLAMHPIEHLYYFATVLPSLFFLMSPFHMLWNGLHAVISPAAGHSGWEDHWQADQLHYLHHAKFECNYGGGGIPLDKLFGTYRDKLGSSRTYKGASTEADSKAEAAQNDNSGSAKGKKFNFLTGLSITGALPSEQDGLYFLSNAAVALVLYAAIAHPASMPVPTSVRVPLGAGTGVHVDLVALLVSVGPVFFALVLRQIYGDRMSLLWPFHKEKIVGPLGVHILVGTLFTVGVVYYTVALVFTEDGFSAPMLI